jgi:hypothetical protein
LAAIAEVWRHGSVISSWLLDLTAIALREDPQLSAFAGRVNDSGEGRCNVHQTINNMNKKWKQSMNKCVEFLLILLVISLFFSLFMPLFILATNGNLRLDQIDTIIGACSYGVFTIIVIIAIFLLKLVFKLLKISMLLKSYVVFLPATKTYAIPLRMVGSKIRLLIPELRDSYVNYSQGDFSPSDISLIRRSTRQKAWSIRQISGTAKELFEKIKTQQDDLGDRIDELTRLENLARSSELYAKQAQLYSRAKLQIWNALQSNYVLEKECEHYIREVLIGGELANYDLANIPDILDIKIRLNSRCKQVSAEYEYLKLEMQAYNILKVKS